MKIGSLFSGYEGLGMAVQSVLGGDIAWVSDIDPGACKILAHRYPDVPNIGDITTVDWSAVEPVDVLTGGFPCQDVSAAGKRAGIAPGTRSGLWSEMHRAIVALRPPLVVIENVRGLLSATAQHPAHGDVEPCPWCMGDDEPVALRALGAVLGDLADSGFHARWTGLRAADVGAPHGRFRVFVTAWPAADANGIGGDGAGLHGSGERRGAQPADGGLHVADADGERLARTEQPAAGRRSPADDALGRGDTPADSSSDGRHEGWPEPARLIGGSDDAVGSAPTPADADRDGLEGVGRLHAVGRDADGCSGADVAWGQYEPAIRRWEQLTRPAPAPTEIGAKGQPRLSPAFVEWMQGLPAGWVTDVPGLTRNEQLKALGNGVVPQQAAHALRMLLPDLRQVAA